MRRNILAILAAVVYLSTMATGAHALPADCGLIHCDPEGQVQTTDTGFKYVYSAATKTLYKIPTRGVATSTDDPKIQYEYFYQVDCPNAPPVGADGDVGDQVCEQAQTTCGPGRLELLIWYRVEGTTGQPIESTNTLCSGGDNEITLDDLIAQIGPQVPPYLKTKDLDKSTIAVQPATAPLVNLPTVFSATPTGETVEMPVTQPVAGTIDLVPSYSWDFGDDTTNTITAAGTPYDGTDPQTNPDHYPVEHTYRQPGNYTVKLIITWTATTLHLPGLGDFPVNETHGEPGQIAITAHEAHAVLVSS